MPITGSAVDIAVEVLQRMADLYHLEPIEEQENHHSEQQPLRNRHLLEEVSEPVHASVFFLLPPASASGLGCNLAALLLGHSDETTLAADLTAFSPHSSHVSREVSRDRNGFIGFSRRRFGSGVFDDPLGELVRVAWPLAFSDSHAMMIPQGLMPKRGCGNPN
jgi:hypothetical protein